MYMLLYKSIVAWEEEIANYEYLIMNKPQFKIGKKVGMEKCFQNQKNVFHSNLAVISKNIFNPSKIFNHCLKDNSFPKIWKLSGVCSVLKNASGHSSLSHYQSISLLNVIKKIFRAIINKEVVKYLNMDNLLSNKQY